MDVKTKYDTLALYEGMKHQNEIGYAVHKRLDFSRLKINTDHHNDINDWLAMNFALEEGQTMLDAGCGTGKTIFCFLGRYTIHATGISKSSREIEIARIVAQKAGFSANCSFRVSDYHDFLPEKFDLIIALESLKHADDLEVAIRNLAGMLQQHGKFIIIEDLLRKGAKKLKFRRLLYKNWSLKEIYERSHYLGYMKKAGMICIHEYNFTSGVRKCPKFFSFLLILVFGLLKALALTRSYRRLMAIYQAGFIYEYYYASGKLEYRVMVFQRKLSNVN